MSHMAERASMIHPPIEILLGEVDAKFSLVTLAAKRARQINSYFSQLGEGLGLVVPPQVASVSRKPLSIALEEIAAHKIAYFRPEVDENAEAEGAADGTTAPQIRLADDVVADGVAELGDADEPESAGP